MQRLFFFSCRFLQRYESRGAIAFRYIKAIHSGVAEVFFGCSRCRLLTGWLYDSVSFIHFSSAFPENKTKNKKLCNKKREREREANLFLFKSQYGNGHVCTNIFGTSTCSYSRSCSHFVHSYVCLLHATSSSVSWASNMPSRAQIFYYFTARSTDALFARCALFVRTLHRTTFVLCHAPITLSNKKLFQFRSKSDKNLLVHFYFFIFFIIIILCSRPARSHSFAVAGDADIDGVSCLHSPTFEYVPDAHRTRIWFILFSVLSFLHCLLFAHFAFAMRDVWRGRYSSLEESSRLKKASQKRLWVRSERISISFWIQWKRQRISEERKIWKFILNRRRRREERKGRMEKNSIFEKSRARVCAWERWREYVLGDALSKAYGHERREKQRRNVSFNKWDLCARAHSTFAMQMCVGSCLEQKARQWKLCTIHTPNRCVTVYLFFFLYLIPPCFRRSHFIGHVLVLIIDPIFAYHKFTHDTHSTQIQIM